MNPTPIISHFSIKPLATIVVSFALGTSAACAAVAGKTEPIDLAQLYQSYLDHQQWSSDMPEYKKKLLISGIVLGQNASIQGDAFLSAGSPNADGELARLSGSSKSEIEKMKKLSVGASFKATCVLDNTMRTNYLSFSHCTFR